MSASHQKGEHTHPARLARGARERVVVLGGLVGWLGDFVCLFFLGGCFLVGGKCSMTCFCLESCQHKNGNEPTGNNNLVQLIKLVTSKNFRCMF